MDLIKKTINAHLKHLGLRKDKDNCIWKRKILLFSNTVIKENQKNNLFHWLEGYSACHDNK